MNLNLISEQNPKLNQKSLPVENIKKSFKFGKEMIKFIDKNYPNCIGLSAVQVGKLSQLFVVRYLGIKKVFINPVIIPYGKEVGMSEGCMSYPHKHIEVIRQDSVKITYCNGSETVTEDYSGMMARIIQHEYDHLIGCCKVKFGTREV